MLSHKQVQFLNVCDLSTIQMLWVIFIHVIIEVIDILLKSKACLSRQVNFSPFFICNYINLGGMAAKNAMFNGEGVVQI